MARSLSRTTSGNLWKDERVRLRFGNKRLASNPAVSRKGKAMIRVTQLDEHRGMTTARKLTAYGDSMFYPYFSPKQIGLNRGLVRVKRSDQAGAANQQHSPGVMAPYFDLLANSRAINTINGVVRRVASSPFLHDMGTKRLEWLLFVWSLSQDMGVSARGCFASTVCSQAHLTSSLILRPRHHVDRIRTWKICCAAAQTPPCFVSLDPLQ
jgi:hypothetical protein